MIKKNNKLLILQLINSKIKFKKISYKIISKKSKKEKIQLLFFKIF
jgi:hypothetical protein